jgi:hypothetical protein
VQRIVSSYSSAALAHSIAVMHAIHRLLVDMDIYQCMTETEILALLLVALCQSMTPVQRKEVEKYSIFERCADRDTLFHMMNVNLRPIIEPGNHSILVKTLTDHISGVVPNAPAGIPDRDYIFRIMFANPEDQWLILASVLRLAELTTDIQPSGSTQAYALITALSGCLELSCIPRSIFRILASPV